jgi:hypothetical protein
VLFKGRDLLIGRPSPKNPLARNYIYTTLIVFTATAIGCYVTTINYDYRLVFLLPLICMLASLFDEENPLITTQTTYLLFWICACVYIFYLPLFVPNVQADPLFFTLELLDEMVAAPFLFGGSLAFLFRLCTATWLSPEKERKGLTVELVESLPQV